MGCHCLLQISAITSIQKIISGGATPFSLRDLSFPTRDQTHTPCSWEHGILTTGPPGSPLCVCVCSIALLYLTLADAEAEAPVFWSSDADRQLIGNVPDAGKD